MLKKNLTGFNAIKCIKSFLFFYKTKLFEIPYKPVIGEYVQKLNIFAKLKSVINILKDNTIIYFCVF